MYSSTAYNAVATICLDKCEMIHSRAPQANWSYVCCDYFGGLSIYINSVSLYILPFGVRSENFTLLYAQISYLHTDLLFMTILPLFLVILNHFQIFVWANSQNGTKMTVCHSLYQHLFCGLPMPFRQCRSRLEIHCGKMWYLACLTY